MERRPASISVYISILTSVVMIGVMVFGAGKWVSGQEALAKEVSALKAEIASLRTENREMHSNLTTEFVTRVEWNSLWDHADVYVESPSGVRLTGPRPTAAKPKKE